MNLVHAVTIRISSKLARAVIDTDMPVPPSFEPVINHVLIAIDH